MMSRSPTRVGRSQNNLSRRSAVLRLLPRYVRAVDRPRRRLLDAGHEGFDHGTAPARRQRTTCITGSALYVHCRCTLLAAQLVGAQRRYPSAPHAARAHGHLTRGGELQPLLGLPLGVTSKLMQRFRMLMPPASSSLESTGRLRRRAPRRSTATPRVSRRSSAGRRHARRYSIWTMPRLTCSQRASSSRRTRPRACWLGSWRRVSARTTPSSPSHTRFGRPAPWERAGAPRGGRMKAARSARGLQGRGEGGKGGRGAGPARGAPHF